MTDENIEQQIDTGRVGIDFEREHYENRMKKNIDNQLWLNRMVKLCGSDTGARNRIINIIRMPDGPLKG
jgi:hypothetical protein